MTSYICVWCKKPYDENKTRSYRGLHAIYCEKEFRRHHGCEVKKTDVANVVQYKNERFHRELRKLRLEIDGADKTGL